MEPISRGTGVGCHAQKPEIKWGINPCGIFRKIKAFEGAAVFDSAAFFQTKTKKRGENGGKRRQQPGRCKAGGREETESPHGENQ